MANDTYVHGTHNILCAECGFKYKRNQLTKRYDGLLVCDKDWEEEHPMDRKRKTPRTPTPVDYIRKDD
jgi:hypothetical protein